MTTGDLMHGQVPLDSELKVVVYNASHPSGIGGRKMGIKYPNPLAPKEFLFTTTRRVNTECYVNELALGQEMPEEAVAIFMRSLAVMGAGVVIAKGIYLGMHCEECPNQCDEYKVFLIHRIVITAQRPAYY